MSITEEWDIASFPYVIKPWPPDYRNASGYEKYEYVELPFWNETHGQTGKGIELCRVVYEFGLMDNTTGLLIPSFCTISLV